jgi:hypothetical protein
MSESAFMVLSNSHLMPPPCTGTAGSPEGPTCQTAEAPTYAELDEESVIDNPYFRKELEITRGRPFSALEEEEIRGRRDNRRARELLQLVESAKNDRLLKFAKIAVAKYLRPDGTAAEQQAARPPVKESAKARHAFCCYRDLGPRRTLIAAYRAATGRANAQNASGQWKRWFTEHDWSMRVRDYDEELAARAGDLAAHTSTIRLAEFYDSAYDTGATAAALAKTLLDKATAAIDALDPARVTGCAIPGLARAAGAIALAAVTMKGQAVNPPNAKRKPNRSRQ